MDTKIIAVVIGVIGAVLGVYAKEYIQSRDRKRKAISMLRANLYLFLSKVQENDQLSKLFHAGSILDQRYIDSIKSGDDTKYKELLSHIKSIENQAENNDLLSDNDIDELCSKVKACSRREIDIIFEEIDRIREDVEHGTYIIANSEIECLDLGMVHRVFQVKRSINEILISAKVCIAGIYERDEVDKVLVKLLVLGLVKESIFICRHILPLAKLCEESLN